jgi:hypothetical protein
VWIRLDFVYGIQSTDVKQCFAKSGCFSLLEADVGSSAGIAGIFACISYLQGLKIMLGLAMVFHGTAFGSMMLHQVKE